MNLRLGGKAAIVTGGSAGIGLACAVALHGEGVSTAIVARDPKRLEQAVRQIRSACALVNFTKGISGELIRQGIRINAISPGPTATEWAKRLKKQIAEAKGISELDAWRESVQKIPQGRMVGAEEIAALAAFLVSDVAASIVGTEIAIDGGSDPSV